MNSLFSKSQELMKYLALLRGINVGGNKKVSMSDLKDYFVDQGFTDVITVLNTGNVIFRSEESLEIVENQVSHLLEKEFDFDIPSVVYGYDELIAFLKNDNVENMITSTSRGNKVIFTFVRNLENIQVQELSNSEHFEIVHSNDSILCLSFSVENIGTPVIMKTLDSTLNKKGTSRNLNTLNKILNKLEEI